MHALLVRSRSWLCALPLEDVRETLRALPVVPVANAPAGVRGAAVIRGAPTPVLDLAALLGAVDDARGSRFVTVRVGEGRTVALEVDEVLGTRALGEADLAAGSPLLAFGPLAALGARDGALVAVLATARLLPAGATV